jgi:hypothetical protein
MKVQWFVFPVVFGFLACAAWAGESIDLFNGKDLKGWTFDISGKGVKPEQVWSVKDGILVCTGKPAGVIRTEKEYGNYELVLEWRWPKGGKPGNSGCLIHCSEPRNWGPWPKCLEVQLMSGDAGDFWMLGEKIQVAGKKPKGRRWENLTDGSEKPIGEWNTMKIRALGNKVTVWVNGEKVNEGVGCSASKGAICLQSEGGEIHFRKVRLTPMKAPAAESGNKAPKKAPAAKPKK